MSSSYPTRHYCLTRGFWPWQSRLLVSWRPVFAAIFFIEVRFISSSHDSSQGMGLDTPPSSLIVSANSALSSEDQPFGKCDLSIGAIISFTAFIALSPPIFVQTRIATSRSGATHANAKFNTLLPI